MTFTGRGGSNPPSDTPTTSEDTRSPGSHCRPPGLHIAPELPRGLEESACSHILQAVLLRTTEKDGYRWVECAGCESGWQVPYYAESVG